MALWQHYHLARTVEETLHLLAQHDGRARRRHRPLAGHGRGQVAPCRSSGGCHARGRDAGHLPGRRVRCCRRSGYSLPDRSLGRAARARHLPGGIVQRDRGTAGAQRGHTAGAGRAGPAHARRLPLRAGEHLHWAGRPGALPGSRGRTRPPGFRGRGSVPGCCGGRGPGRSPTAHIETPGHPRVP